MRQPLPIMTKIASALSQWVIRTTNGGSTIGHARRIWVTDTISGALDDLD